MVLWGGVGEVLKFAGKVVAVGAAGTIIVSTGGVAAPLIGVGVYASGKLVKVIAKDCDNEFFEEIGDIIEDVGIDGITGGLFSLGIKTAGHLAAKEIAKNGRKVITTAKFLIRTGQTIKIGKRTYKVCGDTVNKIKLIASAYHGHHKSEGRSYDSDCPICRSL